MSETGGIIRSSNKIAKEVSDAEEMLKNISGKIGAGSVRELAESFMLMDHCLTHFIYLEAIRTYISKGGRSRGSFIVVTEDNDKQKNLQNLVTFPNLCEFNREIEKDILEISYRRGKVIKKLVKVRELPSQNLWFEKVWKEYLEDNYIGC